MATADLDVLRLPDPQLERYGKLYRLLCRRQGNDLLMKDGRQVEFTEFIFSMEADQERARLLHKMRRSGRGGYFRGNHVIKRTSRKS